MGYQEILISLCGERTEYIALPNEPVCGFRLIAQRALKFADDYVRDQTVVSARRLQGVFNVLWQVFGERDPDEFRQYAQDFEIVHDLVLATFRAPLARDMHLAFREGVRVIKKLIDIGGIMDKGDREEGGEEGQRKRRPTDAIRAFVKQFAIGFYERHGVATADWQTATLNPQQRMLVEAFPVLWQGGIDFMFPLFFRAPVVSGEFNRAFFEGICSFGRVRFVTYVHEHGIIDCIIACARFSPLVQADEDGEPARPSLNPQIWGLARYIATGLFKKRRQVGKIRPFPTPPEYKEEYEKLSTFITGSVLPYFNLIEHERAKAKA